jgi:hypothetical protein
MFTPSRSVLLASAWLLVAGTLLVTSASDAVAAAPSSSPAPKLRDDRLLTDGVGPRGTFTGPPPRITALAPLPTGQWIVDGVGLSDFSVQFSQPVVGSTDAVQVWGLARGGGPIQPTERTYDAATRTLRVRFVPPLRNDVVTFAVDYSASSAGGVPLDGEFASPLAPQLPSGDGLPGGPAVVRFRVLAGDVTRDGSVNQADATALITAIGTRVGEPGYSAAADLNGDGGINVLDVIILSNNLGASLPEFDALGPSVTSITPNPAADLTADLDRVTVFFSEPVQADRLSPRAGYLAKTDGTGLIPAASAVLASDRRSAVFTFSPAPSRCSAQRFGLSSAVTSDRLGLLRPITPAPEFSGVRVPPVVTLDPIVPATNQPVVTVAGSAQNAASVRVVSPGGTATLNVGGDGRFSGAVILSANTMNRLFVTALSPCSVAGLTQTVDVIQDQTAPTAILDFPAAGATITAAATDVGGRVADLLSGFDGLSVTVNGQPATVTVGNVDNGSFIFPNFPLNATGTTTITVLARDRLGNQSAPITRTVTRGTIPAGTPSMAIDSGNMQAATVGGTLAQPIVVRMLTGDGSPFIDKLVTFTVTRSDGRLAASLSATDPVAVYQTRTDAFGRARAFWKLGSDAGSGNNRVEVASTSVAGTVVFCASGLARTASQINIGMGNNQVGEAGAPLPAPFTAFVNDGQNAVGGVPVTFTVTEGDGSFPNGQSSIVVSTSPTGQASTTLTLGTAGGQNTVEASIPSQVGLPATFLATGLVRQPNTPTSFVGLVLDNASRPLGGATVSMRVNGQAEMPVVTDVSGRFRFASIRAGAADLIVDARTATQLAGQTIPTGSFPMMEYHPLVVPNTENSLPTPVLLPELPLANRKVFNGSQDVTLTVEGMEGVEFLVRANTRVTRADGTVAGPSSPITLSLNQVHFDEVPMPLPNGAATPFAWTVQPTGTRFDPPIQVKLPNMTGLPAGFTTFILQWNHEAAMFENVGSATVTTDGASIVSDPGAGIRTAAWGGWTPPPPPVTNVGQCGPFRPAGPTRFSSCGPISGDQIQSTEQAANQLLGAVALAFTPNAILVPERYRITWGSANYAGDLLNRYLNPRPGDPPEVFSDGSPASEDVKSALRTERDEFVEFQRRFEDRARLAARIAANLGVANPTEPINLGAFDFYKPGQTFGKNQLAVSIGGVGDNRARVEVSNISRIGNDVRATFRITIEDDYQFSTRDAALSGCDEAARFLQERGRARGFLTRVVSTFTETFPLVPPNRGAAMTPSRTTPVPDFPNLNVCGLGVDSFTRFTLGGVTARGRADGSFTLVGVPVSPAAQAVRIVRNDPDGGSTYAIVSVRPDRPNARIEVPTVASIAYERPAELIRLLPEQQATVIAVGENLQLRVQGAYSDGSVREISGSSQGTSFSTTGPAISVTSNGLVTGASPGTAFVLVSNLGVTATRRLVVGQGTFQQTIEGVAQGADGSPVAGASISTVEFGGQATSGPDGRFALTLTLPGGTTSASLVALATVNGQAVTGGATLAIAAGQVADAGIIVLRGSCPSQFASGFGVPGLNGWAYSMTEFDEDGSGPNPPSLFIGGTFTTAGGQPANNIARWNGSSWSSLGVNTANGVTGGGFLTYVYALAVFDEDGSGPNRPALFVGGNFSTAGGQSAPRVARWNGSSWSSLQGDFSAWFTEVRALAVFDEDGLGPNRPSLFVGGRKTTFGGFDSPGVARWTGSAANALFPPQTGFGGPSVYALAVFDEDGETGSNRPSLFAGGQFSSLSPGGPTMNSIARYNGSSWSSLGTGAASGVGNTVWALTVWDEDESGPGLPALFVGGSFLTAGSQSANNIARWNGSSWSSVGIASANGLDNTVNALAAFDEDGGGPRPRALFVGGGFTTAGGQPASRIARWNGSSWSSLGTGSANGVSSSVSALTAFDEDGDGPSLPALFVGGGFTTAGGIPSNNIAKWFTPASCGPSLLATAGPGLDAGGAGQGPGLGRPIAGGGIDAASVDPLALATGTPASARPSRGVRAYRTLTTLTREPTDRAATAADRPAPSPVDARSLGSLGGTRTVALASGRDARRVVGLATTPGDAAEHAFLWTPEGGLVDLNALVPAGSGWVLEAADGLDGPTGVVGRGTQGGRPARFRVEVALRPDPDADGDGRVSPAELYDSITRVLRGDATGDYDADGVTDARDVQAVVNRLVQPAGRP